MCPSLVFPFFFFFEKKILWGSFLLSFLFGFLFRTSSLLHNVQLYLLFSLIARMVSQVDTFWSSSLSLPKFTIGNIRYNKGGERGRRRKKQSVSKIRLLPLWASSEFGSENKKAAEWLDGPPSFLFLVRSHSARSKTTCPTRQTKSILTPT